ncbi:EF-hand calcium-binding domain-containing protein 6-like [Rhinatrema bivittatum]|uniref:EF-hand calcium-binding domain-containing protein 6-like n=1 Tax=Rhinatrema bivittatum TaxID=194408 RepID=UPI001129E3CD|nr:EF-hand calcium-binding domain-containing protein 6-like [Rhinatrema bivittatum]
MASHLLPVPRSGLPRLPRIQHPLSLLGDPDTISVRGFSRAQGELQSNRAPSTPEKGDLAPILAPLQQQHIPEGMQVIVSANPSKMRLPIFGQPADIGSRAESRVSLASSRASSMSRPGTQLRIDVDELEHVFREKMRTGGYFTLRQMFKNNDPEGKGQVNRDVLLMLLTKFLGRFISSKQYYQLLLRLKLNDKAIIKFEELYAAIRDPMPAGLPAWLDPINRRQTDRVMMTASQVHAQLKEKAKQRFLDLADLIPQKNPGGATRILMPEFRNMLNQLGFSLEDEEFEKLWKRYDTDGTGALKGNSFLKKLGIEFRNGSSNHVEVPGQFREMSKAELQRKASLSVEKWLKDIFRQGFKNMKEEFEKHDPWKIGKVEKEDFLSVLEKFDLHLKQEHFNLFLARCGLENSLTGISYMDFLRNFQDRSDRGITHKILSNPKHKFHREDAKSPASTLTAVEAKLANFFQSDFLSLLATFHKIDAFEKNVISQQEFRAAIESRFGLELSDEELELLLDRIPLDEDGNVRYPQFMAMFDSRRGVPSLFDEKSIVSSLSLSDEDGEMENHLNTYSSKKDHDIGRTPEQLFKIIKGLLHKNYSAIEKEFEDLDEMNSRRLTQENMYFLLKRFDIHPEITLGEIRRLWQTLITNQDRTLDFLEFVRHFGFSPKSACFPNAKISPPKKGDSDFKIRSKKLNCDSDILVDRVRAKVELFWDDLKREFEELDPYHTGFVSKEEFKDILTELCVHLNEYECEMLTKKFEVDEDGRISYVEFLQPFVLRRQAWRSVNNIEAVMQGTRGEAHQPNAGAPPVVLETLTARMRKKLQGEWKTLRRAFKKLDTDSSGYLSLPEFRSVLKLCNLILNEDEVYHIMSKYDQKLNGQINYKSFLEEACKKRQKPANCKSVSRDL